MSHSFVTMLLLHPLSLQIKKTGKCGLPDHYLLICIYVPNMHLFIVCIMIICIIIVYYCLGLLYVVSKAIVVRL